MKSTKKKRPVVARKVEPVVQFRPLYRVHLMRDENDSAEGYPVEVILPFAPTIGIMLRDPNDHGGNYSKVVQVFWQDDEDHFVVYLRDEL